MDVQLNFINNSNDTNNSDVVIFQRNVASHFDELPVAWKVIKHCGIGGNHLFTFPMDMTVRVIDIYGNITPQLTAKYGDLYSMELGTSGADLVFAGKGTSAKEVQVLNNLRKGPIIVSICKDERLLATGGRVYPQQKAVFEFKPTICIGVALQAEEGHLITSAILSRGNYELSLTGIASADIIMRGGGPGHNSTPIYFNLENIVMA